MANIDIVNRYRSKAASFIEKNYPDNVLAEMGIKSKDHILDLTSSVMMTRDKVMQGGSFVQAVVENNLEQAIFRADSDATRGLKIFVLAKCNCFL
jgi:hypothetical protein